MPNRLKNPRKRELREARRKEWFDKYVGAGSTVPNGNKLRAPWTGTKGKFYIKPGSLSGRAK